MIVGIVGDRNVNDPSVIQKAVDQSGFDVTMVVSGGANGVDKLAVDWAKSKGIPYEEYEANWGDITVKNAVVAINKWGKKYNKLAGFQRNQQIVDRADAIIAIQPNGPTSGTQDTIKKTKWAKKPLHYFERVDEDYEYTF